MKFFPIPFLPLLLILLTLPVFSGSGGDFNNSSVAKPSGSASIFTKKTGPLDKVKARNDPTEVVWELERGKIDLPLSEESVELIIVEETGGRAYFSRYYERPQDPGFSSGVTVGFGYDLKFHSKSDIKKDWAGVASPSEIHSMMSVSGLDGSTAYRIKNKVQITWDEVEIVFNRVTLPRWTKKTKNTYRLDEYQCHPHINGALVSLTFNRGTAISTSNRRIEMWRIRNDLSRGKQNKLITHFYNMQRHWPNHNGLKSRRRDEGGLCKKGYELDRKYNFRR